MDPPSTSACAQAEPGTLLVEDVGGGQGWLMAQALQSEVREMRVVCSHVGELAAHAGLIRSGGCLPIGSPAFVDACLAHAALEVDEWSCYPKGMRQHMLHHPRKVSARFALCRGAPVFVKPARYHAFRGFVLRHELDAMLDAEREQLEILLDVPPSTPVWIAEPLKIASEWRYYVHRGQVLGFCPVHPPGSEWHAAPEAESVSAMMLALPRSISCALDIAVLADGRTTLLSQRDPLRLEWLPYGEDQPRLADFVQLRWARWTAVVEQVLLTRHE